MRELRPGHAEVWVARLDESGYGQGVPPNSTGGKTAGGTEAGFSSSSGDLVAGIGQGAGEAETRACGN